MVFLRLCVVLRVRLFWVLYVLSFLCKFVDLARCILFKFVVPLWDSLGLCLFGFGVLLIVLVLEGVTILFVVYWCFGGFLNILSFLFFGFVGLYVSCWLVSCMIFGRDDFLVLLFGVLVVLCVFLCSMGIKCGVEYTYSFVVMLFWARPVGRARFR